MKTIQSDIEYFYKNPKKPVFSEISDRYDIGFPKLLFEKLNNRFWVKDGTDINYDAGFFISLLSEDKLYLLLYSFVSECFHIIELEKSEKFDTAPTYKVIKHLSIDDELVRFCMNFLSKKTRYLGREELLFEVNFNWNNEGYKPVPLYKVLFMQEGELPYFE